jgi:hypothetical protein
MRRDKYIDKRSRFCQVALENPKQAAKELRMMAIGLENCRTTSDVIMALQEIFCVNERTIFRDFEKKH